MICLILCEVHSSRVARLLCRHIDRFLHPAPCLVHRYGILQMCLGKQQRSCTSTRILCLLSHLSLCEEMSKCIPLLVFQKQAYVKTQQPVAASIQKKILQLLVFRRTFYVLKESAYQNLQGEKRSQNHAVINICKFDYSKYDFLDRSCLPYDTCEIKNAVDLLP